MSAELTEGVRLTLLALRVRRGSTDPWQGIIFDTPWGLDTARAITGLPNSGTAGRLVLAIRRWVDVATG